MLQVAAQEALAAEQGHVAKVALLHLHSLVEKDTDATTFQPGEEAMIISNLVKLVLEIEERQPEGQLQMSCCSGFLAALMTMCHCTGGVEQQQETGRKDTGVQLSEIAGLFGKASSRLAEVGYQQFFGPDSTGR